jgi:nucleoside-diphosphate-sugar epimerase
MSSKTILITGASGFLGASLARSLADANQDVHLVLRNSFRPWRLQDRLSDFSIHLADLADYKSLSAAVSEVQPQTVYHLAAYGAYAHQKDLKAGVETNLLGTMNLVNACDGCAESIINVSTSSEYGLKDRPMREDDLLEPNSAYGVTKAAATLYCQHLARENGMPITTFRIFAAYGYYEEPMRLIPSIILPFLNGRSPRLSSPASVRDFIFVEDIINAFIKATNTKAARGQILNLGTGKQHTVGEVAAAVKDVLGTDKPIQWGTVQKKQEEPAIWRADMSKTRNLLGWKPECSLRDGLRKCIRWYGANQALYSAVF